MKSKMNIYKQKVMFLYNQFLKSNAENNRKFLKFVLVSIIAPVKISMMPSAPPTTELPPTAAHQRPKISFSIDSIVSGEGKGMKIENDGDSASDFNTKVLNRSHHPVSDSDKHRDRDSPLLANRDFHKTFQGVNKLDLLNQFRNVQNPLVNLHHHIQQQLHFNQQQQQQRLATDNGNSHSPGSNQGRVPQSHLRYNFQVPPANLRNKVSENDGSGSAVNNRVTLSPARNSPTVSRSPSPSPSDNRKSPSSQSPGPMPGCSSPESRSAGGSPVNHPESRAGEAHHRQNPTHLPTPVPMVPPPNFQQFAPFAQLGVHNYPNMPGAHPHHPGLPPWGHPPNAPHHPVAHPLYPWLLARHTRLFPPRFGPGAELPAFLFQPFRKPKRIRTAFSPSQLLRLEHAFEKNHYVVGTERKQLAKSLSLSETQVKVWFQNRRTKHKRTEQEEGTPEGKSRNNNSDHPLCGSNLSSSATSADSSTRHYSEEMSDEDEEIIMDDEYSGDEEEMVQVHTSLHSTP